MSHDWRPAEELPLTDTEGESAYLLILCKESSAPVVGYYTTGYLESTGRYVAAFGGAKPVTARWWTPLEQIPASILPPGSSQWAIQTGLAYRDED